ncbi:superoxide dismutase [Lachnospiraceae bacterium ZAX-1]
MPFNTYPYELPLLPYAYDALEPDIDTQTMHYHHDKHFKTYIDNLNNALQPYKALQKLTLIQLLKNPHSLPNEAYTSIMHNGGGVYNHMLFFQSLAPADQKNHEPVGLLLGLINETYGSFHNFKHIFSQKALDVFGSGWTYLLMTYDQKLKIVNLKNQETPLCMEAAPIVLFDVWEHAYYLKYKNLRADYVKQLWNVMTFPRIS